MNLPANFLVKMKNLLKNEYEDFYKSYYEPKKQGLRVNTLKISIDDFLEKSPFKLEKIPWVKEGFFYQDEERPGKHPYHEAGLYYIQEPSAMAVGEMVDAKPGEKVLDLCAAPGGKTTHIASKMNQEGFLLANEIHPARAKILSQNIERMGIKNAVVTNETPARLAERFPDYFDRILVDAPCSGEGMFRKDQDACDEWSLENVALCASRQGDILANAANMLKPGGRLVYSTCTFSPEENEGVISHFLKNDSRFKLERIEAYEGFGKGREDWIPDAASDIDKTLRLWPHKLQGEGHYIAVLTKIDGEEEGKRKYAEVLRDQKVLKDYTQFAKETFIKQPQGDFILFGDQLYMLPNETLSLKNLKVLRPGWHLGTNKKNRFEPSHALALSLKGEEVKHTWNIASDEIESYLRGESISAKGSKGWYLVEVDGFSIGWGKLAGDMLKNHYPKGLRWVGK
ncbi:RsmF rRNA methyltransferase first C-terminal domain-containing protein [Lederbergia wuyishanensis]|uniref:NOL1/NOP2/sun family putative RNA methylase n=1 Tax=Lederbergia wuyishanensis TaxID=1347903 RepID=A0ABU0D5Q4_9BACI|nr:RsmB/NOP family class I SAM-dependent RNA methyltransferase [Lederbergia wuyishanensis]MCJ8008325.1 RsmB/NOP family class I SAM-dependent RNA methyltransferase [Lederbergia wuyishanensis]MDQ0343737.1 NOL1/NOP2/sun family putative RNA methylase [Lederbergia wuyishanensis]